MVNQKKKIVNVTFYLTPAQRKLLKPLFAAIRRLKNGDDRASTCGQVWEDGRLYMRVLDPAQAAVVHRAIMRVTASERVAVKRDGQHAKRNSRDD